MAMAANPPGAIQVYVRLLGEGVDVYRPTSAVPAGTDSATLLPTPDFDPSDEEWEFPPGTLVRTARRVLDGSEVLVAVAAMGSL
jgi:hypothetical protein